MRCESDSRRETLGCGRVAEGEAQRRIPHFNGDAVSDGYFNREGFYTEAAVSDNGTENGTENLPVGASAFLNSYKQAKRVTAKSLMIAIAAKAHITIAEMTQLSGVSERTIKRYLKEMQETGILTREGSDTSGKWVLK